MNGIDRGILSAMAREQMEKNAALGIGKAYQKAVSSTAKYLAPKWQRVADAGKWLNTVGGRITEESGLGAQIASHGGRVAVGAGVGAAAGAISNKDKKKGALTGAIIGGVGAGMLPYALKTLHQTGVGTAKMVSRPLHTMGEAWKTMGRTLSEAEKAKLSPGMREQFEKAEKGLISDATESPGWWTKARALIKGITPEQQQIQQTQHLVQGGQVRTPIGWGEAWRSGQGVGKIRELAGEASRRGWTGQGGVTKYLPTGGKALTVGFSAMGAPTLYRAATGDTSFSEALGEIGSNVGFLAAGAVPGATFVTPLLMGELASRGMKAPAQWFENRKKGLQIPDALRNAQLQASRLRHMPQQIQQVPQILVNRMQQ